LITLDRTILAAAELPLVALEYGINDTVYAQGARAQFVYVVEQGALRRSRLYQGYKKSILQFLLPGDSFGFEVARCHLDTVQALTPTKLLATGREALMDAAASNARLSKMLLDACCGGSRPKRHPCSRASTAIRFASSLSMSLKAGAVM
jgi:CRP-like cAMP-binding protein